MPTAAETLAYAKARHAAGNLLEADGWYRRTLEADPANVEAHFLLGVTCHGLGRLNEAIASLTQATRLGPEHAEAHNYLGLLLAQQGKLDEAVSSFEQARRRRPGSVEFANNLRHALAARDNSLGNRLAAQGKPAEAAACYARALEAKPELAETHNNLGTVLSEQGAFDEAAACYARALELKPDFAEAHNNLGAMWLRQGKLSESLACFERAQELKPDYAMAHANLGSVLARQGKLDEAAACCQRAVELKPELADAHHVLAVVLRDQNKLDEAAACCRRALELKPDFAEAQHTLGAVLQEQGQFDAAADRYRKVLELRPRFAEAHNDLGVVLAAQEKPDEAVACCRRALELKPQLAEASSNLGSLLAGQGRVAQAKECYQSASQFAPAQNVWRLNIASLCPTVFDNNEEIVAYRRRLLSDIEALGNPAPRFELHDLATAACTPSFNLQFQGRDDRPIREACARLFRDCFPAESPRGSPGKPRIGFLVTDGRETSFIKSIGGILERIDADRFEIVVIGSDRRRDRIRTAIRSSTIQLLPVANKFDQFVEAIRAARLDVLYYWEVGTDNTNYFLPFFRLAPVQCTSWGIQVTSGIPQLDYYLSSELVEPDDAAEHYTEQLVLARTLLTYQRRAALPASPKGREFFGIGQEKHLYLCAQQLGKFQPDFDPILAGILRADGHGVVVITEDRNGAFVADQLRRRFAAAMPDVAERIVFLPFQSIPEEYLSLVAAADVLLDPLHFGGVNTTYDGFSLAKPIVTLPSRFHRGRYTLGCYKKMGLSECVASDAQHYVKIAVDLGTDAERRAEVADRIRRASPALFEDSEAVSEHERLFGMLVERARSSRGREA